MIAKNMNARNYINPVTGRITSKFGYRIHPITKVRHLHNGTDIGTPEGTPVLMPAPGKVLKTYSNDRGGNQMIVQFDDGYTMGLAHLRGFNARPGQVVGTGDVIAYTGATGNVTGPHLHLTMRDDKGERIDPETVFDFTTVPDLTAGDQMAKQLPTQVVTWAIRNRQAIGWIVGAAAAAALISELWKGE